MPVMPLSGNHAAAYAAKLSRVEVVAAYPITPQTQIVEKLAEFIEKGELKAKFIRVESEHSAMAACIGAAAVGARAFTATSSQGLLYMSEMLWWAAGARLPIVMGIVTRALAPPWSIWSDHIDVLSQRDTGWIIAFAENAQEVLDLIIQGFKISENDGVLLPLIVAWDAFDISHTIEPVDVPNQNVVDEFLPKRRKYRHTLDVENPFSYGNLAYPKDYMEFRYSIYDSMLRAKDVIEQCAAEYDRLTGRYSGGLIENYLCDDADIVAIAMGSISGDLKVVVDKLRKQGVKVGFCRIRYFRPFPSEALAKCIEGAKTILVFDRDISFGSEGALCLEVRATVNREGLDKRVYGIIYGIGGREVRQKDLENIIVKAYKEELNHPRKLLWLNLKHV